MGRWVHLVCALYVPGIAFSEVINSNFLTENLKLIPIKLISQETESEINKPSLLLDKSSFN